MEVARPPARGWSPRCGPGCPRRRPWRTRPGRRSSDRSRRRRCRAARTPAACLPRPRFSSTSSSYGNAALRILVEQPHEGVRRRAVQVAVELLARPRRGCPPAGQAEEALLENRVAAVPQRQREADALVPVRDAREAVLVPAVGARSGVVVREVVPGGAAGAVVLAHRAPGPLAQVRSPALPVLLLEPRLLEPPGFGRGRGVGGGGDGAGRFECFRHDSPFDAARRPAFPYGGRNLRRPASSKPRQEADI